MFRLLIIFGVVVAALGFEHTREEAVIGWINDGSDEKYIDFEMSSHVDFSEESIELTFNIDGVIFNQI